MKYPPSAAGAGAAVLAITGLVSCDVDLGERVAPPARSFGEIVYREACQRVTYSGELEGRRAGLPLDASGTRYRAFCNGAGPPPTEAPPVAGALAAEREAIVSSVDRAVPEALLAPLDTYLRAIKHLEDDGTASGVLRGAGDLLLGMSRDTEATSALFRLGWRDGFRPSLVNAGLPRALLDYPELDQTLGAFLPLLSPSTFGGSDARAQGELRALLAALQAEMRAATPITPASRPDRTLRLALDFLLATDPALRTLPAGASFPAVRRDHRGVALVAPDAMGRLPGPFADRNGDGLADVDASGLFTDATGLSLPPITPFSVPDPAIVDRATARDADGRALRGQGGASFFQYFDLDQTVLAGLLREGRALLDPDKDIPLGLVSGAAHLLGPRRDAEKTYAGATPLRYRGFDEGQAPLLDLLHGFIQILGYSDVGDGSGADAKALLRGVQALMTYHEREVSRSLAATARAYDEAKKPAYDAAKLAEDATLYDDLMPVVVRLLRTPGLVNDLVEALRDPAVADLGPLLGQLTGESGFFYMNQGQLDYRRSGAVIGAPGKPVRRDAADSDVDKNTGNVANNRSVLHRVLHLVHDADGLSFCNRQDAVVKILLFEFKYPAPCSLFKIDDLALFYVLSVIGKDIERSPGSFAPTAAQAADFSTALSVGFVRDLLRILGLFNLDDALLEGQVGIPGFGRFPPPEAAARLLFQDPSRQSDFLKGGVDNGSCAPKRPGTLCCNQNHGWRDHHDGVLFALEVINPPARPGVTFFTAFKPIVRAFARHDECVVRNGQRQCWNAAKILVDLLAVLHRHWPTPQSRFFGQDYEPQNKKSGVSRYEPLLAAQVGQGDLWPSTLALATALRCARLDGTGGIAGANCPRTEGGTGLPALPVVSNFLRWFLDPAVPRVGGSLRYRDGTQVARRGDGQPAYRASGDPVIVEALDPALAGQVTPYYLLADAFRNKRARLAQDPQAQRRWNGAVSALADQMLLARSGPGYGFLNPRFRPVSQALTTFLIGRVDGHGRAGDLPAWVQGGLLRDLRESLGGPLFAATADLMGRLSEDEAARRALQRLLGHLVDPAASGGRTFQTVVTTAADALQLLLDDTDLVPLVRALAPALAPESGPAEATLGLLRRGREHDPDKVLLTIGKNAYQADPGGLYPLYRLNDAIAEIDRERAGARAVLRTPLLLDDYRLILSTTGTFLVDQQRGLTRFIDIVKTRGGQ